MVSEILTKYRFRIHYKNKGHKRYKILCDFYFKNAESLSVISSLLFFCGFC